MKRGSGLVKATKGPPEAPGSKSVLLPAINKNKPDFGGVGSRLNNQWKSQWKFNGADDLQRMSTGNLVSSMEDAVEDKEDRPPRNPDDDEVSCTGSEFVEMITKKSMGGAPPEQDETLPLSELHQKDGDGADENASDQDEHFLSDKLRALQESDKIEVEGNEIKRIVSVGTLAEAETESLTLRQDNVAAKHNNPLNHSEVTLDLNAQSTSINLPLLEPVDSPIKKSKSAASLPTEAERTKFQEAGRLMIDQAKQSRIAVQFMHERGLKLNQAQQSRSFAELRNNHNVMQRISDWSGSRTEFGNMRQFYDAHGHPKCKHLSWSFAISREDRLAQITKEKADEIIAKSPPPPTKYKGFRGQLHAPMKNKLTCAKMDANAQGAFEKDAKRIREMVEQANIAVVFRAHTQCLTCFANETIENKNSSYYCFFFHII